MKERNSENGGQTGLYQKKEIRSNMFGKSFKVKQDHWLFKSKNALRLIQNLARKHMTAEDVAHFLAQNRTAMLNQNISVTSKEFEHAAAEFSLNLIRRARAGVGFEPNVCSRSNLTRATNWTSEAHEAKFVQLLTWNAGNLARRCLMDVVNNFLCQNWHLACVQEGNSDNVQQPLYDARGIASEKSECGSIVVNAGGGGYKSVEQTHDDEHPNRNWLPRYGKSPTLFQYSTTTPS